MNRKNKAVTIENSNGSQVEVDIALHMQRLLFHRVCAVFTAVAVESRKERSIR